MPRFTARGLRWLKGFHLIAVSCWIGGAISLIFLSFSKSGITDGHVLYGVNLSIHHIDMTVVVIAGAFGCLVTGLLYSLFSTWGFLKYRWIAVKWIATVAAILFGTFFLGPWEEVMMDISGRLGILSLTDETYLQTQCMNIIGGFFQCALLLCLIFISVFKPWAGKK